MRVRNVSFCRYASVIDEGIDDVHTKLNIGIVWDKILASKKKMNTHTIP